MKANSTQSSVPYMMPETVAKPLNELPPRQRQKVTSELQRIHGLVSSIADDNAHKDRCGDKADRCGIEFKPKR